MPIPWIARKPKERFLEGIIGEPIVPTETTQPIPQQEPSYSWESQPYIEPSVREEPQTQGAEWQPSAKQTTRLSWQPQTEENEEQKKQDLIDTFLGYQESAKELATPTVAPVEELTSTSKEEPAKVPFWQRALQVFAAPFNWIQENVINPALSIGLDPLIPDLKREEGEDFFDWKRREWDAWKTPGMDTGIKFPWSENTWKIDVKGVAEFAPWLLIPGAGSVGKSFVVGASRLGKLAPVAKAVGNAIRYSPWGLVEKGTGAAAKAAITKLGAGSEMISSTISNRLFGQVAKEEVSPTVNKLTTFFRENVGPRLAEKDKLIKAQRNVVGARLGEIQNQFARGEITLEQWQRESTLARYGKTNVKVFESDIIGKFEPGEIRQLKEAVATSKKLSLHERQNAVAAIDGLFMGFEKRPLGTIPYPKEIKDLGKVFGEDFANVTSEFYRLPPHVSDKIIDAMNLGRSTMSSLDVSYTLRQGMILDLLAPGKVPLAFKNQLKAFASEKYAMDADGLLKQNPYYDEAVANGVYFAPVEKGAPLAKLEEAFPSNLAEKYIPGVRRSQRAANVFINDMRMGAYENFAPAMKAMGATPEELKGLATFINDASGRGVIPKSLEKYGPTLNAVLFSPRLLISRLRLPTYLVSKNPYVRKLAAQAAIRFVGGGAALLGLLKWSGAADVETDPRSADFGKIKIGNTRLDIWTGYAQYARFAAQMITQQSKSASGNISKKGLGETVGRFAQSKASPAMGFLVDLLRGEDYEGNKLFQDTSGLLTTAEKKFAPLIIQDLIDAMEMGGINPALVTIPSGLGIGVLTYGNEVQKVQNKIAREMGLKDWSEIDPITQRKIEASSKELKTAISKQDVQMMGTQWGDYRLEGNAIEDTFKENVDLASQQFRDTGDGYTFKTKINQLFKDRSFAYKARSKNEKFKEIVDMVEKDMTSAELTQLGIEQLAIRAYNEALFSDDMYDEYGDYRFDEAEARKVQLRQSLGEDLYSYVETYRGISDADMTPEYQQLVIAKQVLKPYWEVQDDADKYFRKDSPAKQRFIARRRKMLRDTNKQIAYYYNLFYKEE